MACKESEGVSVGYPAHSQSIVVDINQFYCVGLEINANHIRSVKDGLVKAITSPIHLGRSTQIWQIHIYNEEDKLTCISRMTASVLSR